MKSKQVLDVQQMQHLQELGLEMKETMLYWARCVDNNPRAATHYGKWVLIKGNNAQTVGLMHWEFIPAYTLQDVLDLLPKQIGAKYTYDLCILPESISYTQFIEGEMREIIYEIPIGSNLLDSTYEMLCWCIKNGYVKTGKEYKL